MRVNCVRLMQELSSINKNIRFYGTSEFFGGIPAKHSDQNDPANPDNLNRKVFGTEESKPVHGILRPDKMVVDDETARKYKISKEAAEELGMYNRSKNLMYVNYEKLNELVKHVPYKIIEPTMKPPQETGETKKESFEEYDQGKKQTKKTSIIDRFKDKFHNVIDKFKIPNKVGTQSQAKANKTIRELRNKSIEKLKKTNINRKRNA